jgi:hypothetical protein
MVMSVLKSTETLMLNELLLAIQQHALTMYQWSIPQRKCIFDIEPNTVSPYQLKAFIECEEFVNTMSCLCHRVQPAV